RMVTVTGVRGRDPESITRAITMLSQSPALFADIPTENVPLEGVGEMLLRLGNGTGPATPHVVVRPWGSADEGDI
ncbi:MAG TPA: hypothetical protein VIG75_13050, partial [Citricoccus sp.]